MTAWSTDYCLQLWKEHRLTAFTLKCSTNQTLNTKAYLSSVWTAARCCYCLFYSHTGKTSHYCLSKQHCTTHTHTHTQSMQHVAPVEGWVIHWYNVGEGKDLSTVRHAEWHSGKANRTSMNHRGIREQLKSHCVPLLLRAAWGAKSLNSCSGLKGTNIMGTDRLVGQTSDNTVGQALGACIHASVCVNAEDMGHTVTHSVSTSVTDTLTT